MSTFNFYASDVTIDTLVVTSELFGQQGRRKAILELGVTLN